LRTTSVGRSVVIAAPSAGESGAGAAIVEEVADAGAAGELFVQAIAAASPATTAHLMNDCVADDVNVPASYPSGG
jgi:hypothetical protein